MHSPYSTYPWPEVKQQHWQTRRGRQLPCLRYASGEGCPLGNECHLKHEWIEDEQERWNRCFVRGAKGHKSRNCTAPLGQYEGKYPRVEQQERPPPQRIAPTAEETQRGEPMTEQIPLPRKTNWLDPESPRREEQRAGQASSSSGGRDRRTELRTEKEKERHRIEQEDNAELRRLLRGLRMLPGNFKGKAEIEELCEDIDRREREGEED